MNKDLLTKIQYLNSINNLNIEDKLTILHKFNQSTENFYKHFNNYLKSPLPIHVKNFLYFLKSFDEFFILKANNNVEFILIKKDFSQYIQIAISKNSLFTLLPNHNLNDLNLELLYLISYKSGNHLGIKFLKKYISFQKTLGIPIILYCEKKLCPYYKKLGFKIIKRTKEDEYFLALE